MLVLPQKHTRTHTLMCAFLLFNVATEFLASTKLNPINMQRKSLFFFAQCCSAFCIPITCVSTKPTYFHKNKTFNAHNTRTST